LPKFPGIKRDFALLLDEAVLAADIEKTVRSCKPISKVLEDVKVFDVYRGKGIEPGKKSVAFSITLRDPRKTLTESEITPWMDGLTGLLTESLGASIRGM
jgi:phenylalanyl-tRNA synthetase beta chain